MGLQKKMDRCIAYFKNNLAGSYLNEAFAIFLSGLTPPKSRVHGTTFHSMQREEDEWVNPLLALKSRFGGKNK
jgi:hypothetical protein